MLLLQQRVGLLLFAALAGFFVKAAIAIDNPTLLCGATVAAFVDCVSINLDACGSDSDCAAIDDDNGSNTGNDCDGLEGICESYTCCDECKTQGLAVVTCASDLFSCERKDCDGISGAVSMMSGTTGLLITGAFAIFSSMTMMVDM